ncbi:MAG: tetratricopeptide repeat protein [Planctomycetota bacterium]
MFFWLVWILHPGLSLRVPSGKRQTVKRTDSKANRQESEQMFKEGRVAPSSRILVLALSLVVFQSIAGTVVAIQEQGGAFTGQQEQSERGFEPPPGTVPNNPQIGLQLQREQAINQLVAEMSQLVPGEIEEGSAQQRVLTDAATKFANRDYAGMKDSLDAGRSMDPLFPPAELLWAAMLFAANDADNGLLMLEEAALQHPEDPGVHLAFTRLAVNQRRYTDGLALLEKSVRLIQAAELSELEDTHYKALYYDMAAELAVKLGKFDQAKINIERLREVSPEDNKGEALLAEIEFEEGNFDRSIELLESYRAQNPGARTPELVLVAWFGERGRIEEASDWIEKAGGKYPDDAIVQLEFANYCVNEERFPDANKAIAVVEEAIEESDVTIQLKAKIAFASEAYSLAESYFERLAASPESQNLDTANMYALSLIENSDPEKQQLARQLVENNFRAMPDSPITQAAFAWVLYRQGDTQNAMGLLSRATAVRPLAPEIAFFAANLMRDQGRTEEAKEVLRGAIEYDGLYLYRSRAKRLFDELETGATDELPAPAGEGG